MKKMIKMCLVLASAAVMTTGVQAATGAGTGTATIVVPITITPTQALAFGKISANTTGGTVNMTVAGVRSIGGGDAVLMNTGSTQTEAKFNIAGEANATYAITLPADSVVTIASGGNTMAVNGFVSSPAATGTLTGGAETVHVGADLVVAGAQAPGAYTGSFNVIVEYN